MEKLWIDAIEFKKNGGWKTESQFVREVGSSYLIASDIPGVPVENAETDFNVKESGYYRIFVRTKNWRLPEAPGQFCVAVDGEELANTCGKMPTPRWYWEIAGDIELTEGNHTIALCDKTGWLSRCSAVLITNDFNFVPSPEVDRMLKQRSKIKGIDEEKTPEYNFDFVVVGAGPGGVPAAISAARSGLKVALISGRPTIGGNASKEGTIGLDGAASKGTGMHETGIPNEIKRTREYNGIHWQESMERLVAAEENITVFLNTLLIDASTENDTILSITCMDTMTLEKSVFKGKYYSDCSGDGWLAYYSGAAYRMGREARHEYNETLAPVSPDTLSMSGCICATDTISPKFRGFYAVDAGEPVKFDTPEWAVKFPDKLYRSPISLSSAPWWLENSNDFDDVWDAEFTRDEMLRIAVGYFGWLKNTYEDGEFAKNMRIMRLPLHNSKRENRRIMGDYVLSEGDYAEGTSFDDAVAYSGWNLDVHHPKGIYSGKEGAFHSNRKVPITPVPYRCLYSLNINNLFMASRCGSYTHIGLGSVRVESTLASFGQAVGVAAALCNKYNCTPRDIYKNHIKELQQKLIREDQTIIGLVNEDENDLARFATVSASSYVSEDGISGVPDNVINGKTRKDEKSDNAWVSDEKEGLPASITLVLREPNEISQVQITADTDLEFPHYAFHKVPEYNLTVSDFTVEVKTDNGWKTVGQVSGNYRRRNVVEFEAVKAQAVRVTVTKTLGSNFAKLNEIRIYR